MSNKQTQISKDLANKKIMITREFDAPLEEVWKAWTDSSVLDTWWAPKPYKAETKRMDFREGGQWLYRMAGPDGEGSWCRVDFKQIIPNVSFSAEDLFCDEEGNATNEFPGMHWENKFSATDTGTKLECIITFASQADMEKIIEMGFEQGFSMAHGNLDEALKK